MSTIHLVRHAESHSNAGLPTQDPKTVQLTEKGKQQAILLAQNWSDKVDLIIHSLYDRTYQTAEPLIHKFSGAEVVQSELIHEFTYLNPEKYKNTTFAQRAPWKELFWQVDDMSYKDDETTENMHDLISRMTAFISSIKDLRETNPDRNIVVFSHGQFIRLLLDVLSTPGYQLMNDSKKRIYNLFKDEATEIKNAQVVDITTLIS